jgi:hypothetical protein
MERVAVAEHCFKFAHDRMKTGDLQGSFLTRLGRLCALQDRLVFTNKVQAWHKEET